MPSRVPVSDAPADGGAAGGGRTPRGYDTPWQSRRCVVAALVLLEHFRIVRVLHSRQCHSRFEGFAPCAVLCSSTPSRCRMDTLLRASATGANPSGAEYVARRSSASATSSACPSSSAAQRASCRRGNSTDATVSAGAVIGAGVETSTETGTGTGTDTDTGASVGVVARAGGEAACSSSVCGGGVAAGGSVATRPGGGHKMAGVCSVRTGDGEVGSE
eukprot:IDg17588t1